MLRLSLGFVVLLAGGAVRAGALDGKWEIQTMGSDREVTVTQKGATLLIHRIMWPEFEGQRYKLEHLYRGKVSGKQLQGNLLVKEDELPDYEVLRAFSGSIDSDDRLTLDGMAVVRLAEKAAPQPAPAPTAVAAAPAQPPAAPPPAPPAADSGASAAGSDDAVALFDRLVGAPGAADLFQVSNKIDLPDPQADTIREARAHFEAKRYKKALELFEQASAREGGGAHRVEIYHQMGLCHLELRQPSKAQALLRKALKLDPNNTVVRQDYQRAADAAR